MPSTVRRFRLFLSASALAALLAFATGGCTGLLQKIAPPEDWVAPPVDNATRAAVAEVIPPAIPIPETPAPAAGATPPALSSAPSPEPAPSPVPDIPPGDAAKAEGAPAAAGTPAEQPSAPEAPPPAPAAKGAPAKSPEKKAVPGAHAPPPAHAAAPVPPAPPAAVRTDASPPPVWAARNEAVAYRVDFLGITMGYAWFQYQGKVSIGGKTAYHLNVRARTSGVLSYIYPVSETIDYYLDAETLEPIRLEYSGRKNKPDDVAIYDQEKGRITYRYRHNGEIRKQVDILPGTHDPVSAAYYFRGRGFGKEEERNVYGGRKVYQISTRLGGTERVHTEGGDFDTVVVQPVIRRDGKVENKGDLKMWVTRDERRLPVRFYGKFRKIREWTLVGVLMTERTGG